MLSVAIFDVKNRLWYINRSISEASLKSNAAVAKANKNSRCNEKIFSKRIKEVIRQLDKFSIGPQREYVVQDGSPYLEKNIDISENSQVPVRSGVT